MLGQLFLVGGLPVLGTEEGNAVLERGWVGLVGVFGLVSFGEYGLPACELAEGLIESLLAFLFLGGVLLDILYD